jgi:hypothetical protein
LGQLYLFFLIQPPTDSIVFPQKVIKIFEPCEYGHFPEGIVENGKVILVSDPHHSIPDWAPWLRGNVRAVINRVRAEIKRQGKERQ